MKFLYKMWLLWQSPRLGSDAFYPLPTFVKNYLSKYQLYERVGLYARLLDGVDMSVSVPNDVACVETLTRLLRNIDPALTSVMTYTPHFVKYMEDSSRFIEIPEQLAKSIGLGIVVISETGTGNGDIENGHTGIMDYGRIWNNNSYTGKWMDSYTLQAWKYRYQIKGGMKTRFFIPVGV